MAKLPCPICGDPNAYLFWIDPEPPAGCPHDLSWHDGSPPEVTDVTQCAHQMGKARQRVEWRKAAPDCFDESGNIRPGKLPEVLERWAATYPPDQVPPVYLG